MMIGNAAWAREWIERYTAYDRAPILSDDELEALVVAAVREPPWQPDTAYGKAALVAVGELRYRATVPGISALVEPTWPVVPYTASDGTVVWEPAGPATFDLHGAAATGWEWKAAKVAGGYDFSAQGSSFSRSQMYAHCVQQAERHSRMALGPLTSLLSGAKTITVAPPTGRIVVTAQGVEHLSTDTGWAVPEWEDIVEAEP